MKYFIISILIIFAVFGVHRAIVGNQPTNAVESGLHRPHTEGETIQAEEDQSIHNTQRENENNIHRY